MQHKSHSFSLVELMVVLVISGIMLAMFLPMIDDVTSGTSVKTGVRSIGFKISQGRKLAQTNREFVALIMPGELSSTTPANFNLLDEYRFSMFRLAHLQSDGKEFKKWVDGSKWEFVPRNALIMEVDTDVGINNNGTTYSKFPSDDGESIVTNVPFDLRLCSGSSTDPDLTAILSSARAIIYKSTGALNSSSRYITINEARYIDGTDWFIKNPGKSTSESDRKFLSSSNQVTIKINSFTGGVKYAEPDKYPNNPDGDF